MLLNGTATYLMSHVTLTADFWALAWPRFVQGLGMGFIFVPLQTLALGTVPPHQMANATAAFNMVRNIGGGIGVAFATAMLARRSQFHQSTLASHVDVWDPETTERLRGWAGHFWAHGADAFTAERRALAMLYRDTVGQAQVLAYADDFLMISALYWMLLALIIAMQRVRRVSRARGAGPRATARGGRRGWRGSPRLPADQLAERPPPPRHRRGRGGARRIDVAEADHAVDRHLSGDAEQPRHLEPRAGGPGTSRRPPPTRRASCSARSGRRRTGAPASGRSPR